jgi:energy-coupling factor transporter ATP-binding protein EcfA2
VAIQISKLSYTYTGRAEPALREVSLTFRPGEVALIVGQSGSGKTTLARCINGLIPHSYKNGTLVGEIRCYEKSTAGLSLAQLARLIGTVMQDPDKQIVATRVFNEIAFGLENLGLSRDDIRARVHEAAEYLHIPHLLDRETHTLSGGELQKVVIAGALAMRPRTLLLDEPLSSLDPPSARDALALFRRLADADMAVVMIEHRVRDALRITPEHGVALHQGAVAFDGDAAGLRAWMRAQRNGRPTPRLPARSVAAQGEPLISFRQVRFAYPGSPQEQLRGVSFDVRAGDVIALMGPNGAGKSTLCKTAIGLLRPSAGQVIVAGEDAARFTVAQIVRKVGYVFQNPAAMLFANTLREELSFGPRNVGMSEDRIVATIARVLETVGLGHLSLDQSPFGLSFGQQKRIALAGVLAMQPDVLILDEPTAGLDDGTAEDLIQRLLTAEHGPQAIVMVTHDLSLAHRFANRVVLVADGQVVADGSPTEILESADTMRRARLDPAVVSADDQSPDG